MPVDVFKAVCKNIDEKINILKLYNFGEPLLHERLAEIVENAPKAKRIEISTNGQVKKNDGLYDALKLNRITNLVVSCDGNGTLEDYERLRPPAKWDVLVEFLGSVYAFVKSNNIDVNLRIRVICENKTNQKKWKRIARGWNAEFRGWHILPDANNMSGNVPVFGRGLCSFMRKKTLYIDSDGSVVPCCAHPKAFVIGNIIDTPYSKLNRKKYQKAMMKKRVGVCAECTF